MTPLTHEEWQEMQQIQRDTCEHENADHLKPGEWFNLDGLPQHIVTVEQFRCVDCGAWLSLGASNDRPARVKREIRAAAAHTGARR